MTNPTSPGRNRLIAAAVLFLVAVTGGLTAVTLDRFVLRPGPHRMHPFPPPRPDEAAFRERMSRELGLTPDQRTRVDSLMDRQLREIRALRAEVQPRLDSVVAQTRLEIEEILTPEQREKARALAKRGHERPGPPPPF
ncbi:MAG: Spy/CpxP family protein refolding chaperone [Gemmatimonadales bacterium]